MRIGVIGAGVSGVAAAATLQRDGHEVILLERDEVPGGVWAHTYPKVTLQNTAPQYHLGAFPWPFEPDLHPTAEQIRRYLDLAIEHYQLDLRLGHEVSELVELADGRGWIVNGHTADGPFTHTFDFVLVAVGQYTQPKLELELPDRDKFAGEVLTEREITDPSVFRGKRVAVVGMGKSALDVAMLATDHGATSVEHVFRSARWLLPEHLLGFVHFTHALFSRVGSVMMTSWAQPSRAEAILHGRLRPLVDGFWTTLGQAMWHQQAIVAVPRGAGARARVARLRPHHPVLQDMRSAAALVPRRYFTAVAEGRIEPVLAELLGFSSTGLRVREHDSERERDVPADLVVVSVGSRAPTFPFMPANYRALLEAEPDGVQLYRHLIHPRVPRLAFTGYNHGFLHIPLVEVGAVWLAAWIAGELELPPIAEMEATIERVRAWKRAHVTFEPSRACAVATRHQQYLDILLQDLQLSPYRKSNPLAEAVMRYGAADYAGVLGDHQRRRETGPLHLRPVALDS